MYRAATSYPGVLVALLPPLYSAMVARLAMCSWSASAVTSSDSGSSSAWAVPPVAKTPVVITSAVRAADVVRRGVGARFVFSTDSETGCCTLFLRGAGVPTPGPGVGDGHRLMRYR